MRSYPKKIIKRIKHGTSNVLGSTKSFFGTMGIPSSVNDWKLYGMKNRYLGKRCFIVGSGPSMNLRYLEPLKNEYTFSANQIFKIFDQTDWRPTFYLIADTIICELHKQAILRMKVPYKFASNHLKQILGEDKRILFFNKTHENYVSERPPFSNDCLQRVEGGYTVTYLAMQLAWYMGFKNIYLLGIDAKYQTKNAEKIEDSGPYSLVKADTRDSYFLPEMISPDEPTFMPLPDRQILAYESARAFMNANGGSIMNAAVDSPLDLFERVDFESLF